MLDLKSRLEALVVSVMTYSDALSATRTFASRGLLWPILLVIAFLVAYIPTFIALAQGPWQTEQEGHGPLIIAAALWLVWQSRGKISSATSSPAPITGWIVLLFGLVMMVLARNQEILSLEVASEIPVIAGCVLLLLAGWNVSMDARIPDCIPDLFGTRPGLDDRWRNDPAESADL